MLTELLPLWQRIEAFELDDDAAAAPLSSRLARDNRWPVPFARRAIQEYKRFILLAMCAGHPVTPSDAVDQVWHLHLTYTVSYWEHLCQGVLGVPLHHGPSRGGPQEAERYRNDYERTLESYRRLFGEPAPEDLWPPAAERFGQDLTHVRLRACDYWLLKKPRARSRAALAALRGAGPVGLLWLGCLLLVVPAIVYASGPAYLVWHALLSSASLLLVWRLRGGPRRARSASEPSTDDDSDETNELAFLAGGPERVLQVALVELVASGALSFDARASRLSRSGAAPAHASPIARRVHEHVGPGLGVRETFAAAPVIVASFARSLRRRGLIPACSGAEAALLLVPVLLASVRIALGLIRGAAVGFLVLASLAGVLLALAFYIRSPRLTPLGPARLKALGARELSPERLPRATSAPAEYDPLLAWNVALSGPVILAGTDLEPLTELRPPPPTAASARDAGGCSGGCAPGAGGVSPDGGAGGCSAGGCGAGGCGGCGGGGCGG